MKKNCNEIHGSKNRNQELLLIQTVFVLMTKGLAKCVDLAFNYAKCRRFEFDLMIKEHMRPS